VSIERREHEDGTVVYLARPHVDGRRLRARTFEREREAKAYLRTMESRRRRASSQLRVREFVPRWLDDYAVAKRGPTRGQRKSERTIRTYRYALAAFLEEYGQLRLDDFDRPLARKIAATYPPSRVIVIRNLFGDAHDDGLVDQNPFADLQLAHSEGRAGREVMPERELHRLADSALPALGPEHGPAWRTAVLFAAYAGPRLESFCALEWPDVDLAGRTVRFRKVKFGRPYTAILLPELADELRWLPRRTDTPAVFRSLRGRPLAKGSHFYAWDKLRQAAGMPALEWHELRHWCGHHFYVTLGFSAEEAGAQLGHKDGREIVDTYGHGRQGALERLHRGTARPREIRATGTPQAGAGEAS
jgi:integrase